MMYSRMSFLISDRISCDYYPSIIDDLRLRCRATATAQPHEAAWPAPSALIWSASCSRRDLAQRSPSSFPPTLRPGCFRCLCPAIYFSPTVPLISTLKTVSAAGEVTDMVRSTGILPRAMENGAPELATSIFTPSDNLVSASTIAATFSNSAADLRSGTTVMGAIEMGPSLETWMLNPPFLPVPLTLATMGYLSCSSDPWTLACASSLKDTIRSPVVIWIFSDIKDGRACSESLISMMRFNSFRCLT